jgi:hypothetical protein
MQDSKSVEAIAAQLRSETAAEAALLKERNERSAHQVASCLGEVRDQLEELNKTPTGGVRVYLSDSKDAKGLLTGLSADISIYPPWVRRPFATYRITAHAGDPDAEAVPNVCLEWPERESALGMALHESISKLRKASDGSVVREVKLIAAECLNRRAEFEFASPLWYRATGTALAWPIALLVYLATWLSFGLWGFLLGWIPAWIAFALSRLLWLPALVFASVTWLRS